MSGALALLGLLLGITVIGTAIVAAYDAVEAIVTRQARRR
jgi:hypothetical protein